MASIDGRRLLDGSIRWRVRIRRKGIPPLTITFAYKEEAQEWVKQHEALYILKPEKYQMWYSKNKLRLRRLREMK